MKTIHHKFVEFIPDEIEEGILYITIKYCTAIHLCVCGCGNKVITPISPTDWQLTFDGKTISLFPSIGNWNFKCKSHYFITNNGIKMEKQMSQKKINEGRAADNKNKENYYNGLNKSESL